MPLEKRPIEGMVFLSQAYLSALIRLEKKCCEPLKYSSCKVQLHRCWAFVARETFMVAVLYWLSCGCS